MASFECFVFILLTTVVAADRESRETIMSNIKKLQTLNRGEFAQPFLDNESLEKLSKENLPQLQRSIEMEIVCSYAYNMLYHMRLTEPTAYDFSTSLALYDRMDNTYPWARNMLVHVFNMNIDNTRRHADTFLLFHLYLKRMSGHHMAATDCEKDERFLNVLHEMRDTMFGNLYVTLRDNRCSMYKQGSTGARYDFKSYLIDIQNDTPSWQRTFDKLERDCEQTQYNIDNSRNEISGEYFDLETLHLTNIFTSPNVMNDLVTIFGEIHMGYDVKYTMILIFDTIQTGRSSFEDYIGFVRKLHVCFIQTLNLIMLHILLRHLAYLKTTPPTNGPLENKMFVGQLMEYANFLDFAGKVKAHGKLSPYLEDSFGYLIYTFQTESDRPIGVETIADLELQTIKLLEKIRTILKNTANVEFQKSLAQSIYTVSMPELEALAYNNSISFAPDSPDSVMCAEIFVKYVKTELQYFDYRVIRSVIDLPKYNVFVNRKNEKYIARNP